MRKCQLYEGIDYPSPSEASGGASAGIISILELAQADFTKSLAESNAEEVSSAKQYEQQTQANSVLKVSTVLSSSSAKLSSPICTLSLSGRMGWDLIDGLSLTEFSYSLIRSL